MTDATPVPAFAVTVDQNRFLAVGDRTVQAVVAVEATGLGGTGGPAGPPSAAEVVIIDTSRSMLGAKIDTACQAAAAAVEALREGTEFAVIAGATEARRVYPPAGGLARASERTRAEAVRALRDVAAHGSTSMSTWLLLAKELLAGSAATLKHALLLTDGLNTEGESPLLTALELCRGEFVCDCRGVGDDWEPRQMKTISHALNGRWKPVRSLEELVDDFRSVINASMDKRLAGVSLHITLRGRARVVRFGEVMPTLVDLTDRAAPAGPTTFAYPLGSWGDEARDYAVRIEVEQAALNIETEGRAAAARLQVMVPATDGGLVEAASAWVFTTWTADFLKSAPIDPRVAYYLGQQDLARAVREALDSHRREAEGAETEARFGRAVALAHQHGRQDLFEGFSEIVTIVDAARGTVRMRPRHEIRRASIFWTDYASSQTTRPPDGDPAGDPGVR